MSTSPRVVYVSAPQGAGKSNCAAVLAELFKCTNIVDGWDGIAQIPDGSLVLTNLPWPVTPRGAQDVAAEREGR